MTQPTLGIVLFARMSSSRLPGKMLARIGPTTLLERVVGRARLVGVPLLLATSTDRTDDALHEAGEGLGVEVFRGSVDDVLGRACRAARSAGFDGFARLCGDRPFFPIDDMRRALGVMEESLREGVPCDLVTTRLPRPVPPGLLTEVVRTAALEEAHASATSPDEFEHVTTRFYARPGDYRIHALPTPLQDLVGVSLTVDTESDRVRIGALIDACPDIAESAWSAALRARAAAFAFDTVTPAGRQTKGQE